MSELERLMGRLQKALDGDESGSADGGEVRRAGDAIDAELARPGRVTAVVSLRDAPEVEAFRDELINGMIRADTANRLLKLVNEIVTRLLV